MISARFTMIYAIIYFDFVPNNKEPFRPLAYYSFHYDSVNNFLVVAFFRPGKRFYNSLLRWLKQTITDTVRSDLLS